MGLPQLLVQTHYPRRRVVEGSLEYISALRVVMGCYSYVGSFTVSREGKNLVFFPWQDALAYADSCMSQALIMGRKLKSEGALVAWLRRRDELIRADMAARINDLSEELTGAEALAKAMEEHKHLWNMKDGEVPANTSGELGGNLVEQFTVPMHLETEADSSANSRKRRRFGLESDGVKA